MDAKTSLTLQGGSVWCCAPDVVVRITLVQHVSKMASSTTWFSSQSPKLAAVFQDVEERIVAVEKQKSAWIRLTDQRRVHITATVKELDAALKQLRVIEKENRHELTPEESAELSKMILESRKKSEALSLFIQQITIHGIDHLLSLIRGYRDALQQLVRYIEKSAKLQEQVRLRDEKIAREITTAREVAENMVSRLQDKEDDVKQLYAENAALKQAVEQQQRRVEEQQVLIDDLVRRLAQQAVLDDSMQE